MTNRTMVILGVVALLASPLRAEDPFQRVANTFQFRFASSAFGVHAGCGCTAPEPDCGCTAPEPDCGCTAPEPDCGCTAPEPDCGCTAPEPDCGCTAPEPTCEAACGLTPRCGCRKKCPPLLKSLATEIHETLNRILPGSIGCRKSCCKASCTGCTDCCSPGVIPASPIIDSDDPFQDEPMPPTPPLPIPADVTEEAAHHHLHRAPITVPMGDLEARAITPRAPRKTLTLRYTAVQRNRPSTQRAPIGHGLKPVEAIEHDLIRSPSDRVPRTAIRPISVLQETRIPFRSNPLR